MKAKACLFFLFSLLLSSPLLGQTKRGHFLVSNRSSSNGLAEFDQNTSLLKTAAFQAQGVSINPLSGNVLVTVPGNPSTEILELDADLNFLRVFANPGGNINILHLAHNPVANTVIATNHCGLYAGPSAWVFDSTGNQIATINVPTTTCTALGVAVRDDGRYLLGARLDTGIFEYGPTNNFLGILRNTQSLVSRITGLAIQKSTGNIYVSTEFQGIVVLDSGGTTVIKTITGNGLNGFHGLAFDENENLYVANTASNNILVFDPAGNLVSSFPSGGIEPFQIAFFPTGLVPPPTPQFVSPISVADLKKVGAGFFAPDSHLGQDYWADKGTSVRAISRATVAGFFPNVAGFGGWCPTSKDPNRSFVRPGPALWLRHQLSDGTFFHVLYGHMQPSQKILDILAGRLPRGTVITQGEMVGTLAPFIYCGTTSIPHLHLGIWLQDAIAPSPWGYGTKRSFTDPIAFLLNQKPAP